MKLSFSGKRLSRLSHERGPSGELLPPEAFEKTFEKKLLKTFGSLKITPYLCTRFWEVNLEAELRKKTSKKVPQKFGGYTKNSLPLQPLSDKTEGIKKSDLWRDLHKQYSSTRAKLETVLGKKEPSILIYIGNELLIRNPDRATTYLDIIWYSGVKDTFTMKSLILAQDER